MKRTSLLLLLLVCGLFAFAERYTVIVSVDGFRWDYSERWSTPAIDAISAQGVEAVMRPSFPSSTFPNHYTLATGLVPDHHGIINNSFVDQASGKRFSLKDSTTNKISEFWGGEPIWVTAHKQGVRTGVVYWPGSDVKICGMYPDTYHDYAKAPLLTYCQRVAEVVRLLSLPEEERPRLVMLYFDEPDHTGHACGPFAEETHARVREADVLVGELYNDIRRMAIADSVNFIVTSDHGMTQLSPERLIDPFKYVPKEWVSSINWSVPTEIQPAKGKEKAVFEALQKEPHMRVFRKADVPAHLQYGSNRNVLDLVLIPDVGWTFGTDGYRPKAGTHGFDPYCADMHVIFRATGPDFRKNYVKKETFQNTAIYSLLCHLLGIEAAPSDGSLDPVRDMLAE